MSSSSSKTKSDQLHPGQGQAGHGISRTRTRTSSKPWKAVSEASVGQKGPRHRTADQAHPGEAAGDGRPRHGGELGDQRGRRHRRAQVHQGVRLRGLQRLRGASAHHQGILPVPAKNILQESSFKMISFRLGGALTGGMGKLGKCLEGSIHFDDLLLRGHTALARSRLRWPS